MIENAENVGLVNLLTCASLYWRRDDLLPKRSTLVDQNLESESIDSQLSIAIFRAPRDLLVTQDYSI